MFNLDVSECKADGHVMLPFALQDECNMDEDEEMDEIEVSGSSLLCDF